MAETVTVAIPSFKRPRSLARLLEALTNLQTDAHVRVLVADNDADKHEGHDFCRSLENYRWPLTSIIVPERGIAPARNALVQAALADGATGFVAMIDDDEWPAPGWLAEFLRVQAATGADCLQGSILFARAAGDAWAEGSDGLSDIRRPTGPIALLQGAGNLFMTRACLESMAAPWFDPAFALSGGEDREFFVRLQSAGKRFAWADQALAYGEVPAIRASLSWVLRRAFSVGNSDMRVLLKHRPGAGTLLRETAKIAGALLLSPPAAAILFLVPNRRTAALRKFCRAAGKLAAILGAHYNEYSVIHGE
jgi:glycosyltransferase involved in cell wall biosynthesis